VTTPELARGFGTRCLPGPTRRGGGRGPCFDAAGAAPSWLTGVGRRLAV
jgi:hypothetical protein